MVGDEVGREIAPIKLHTFDYVEGGLGALGLFDRNRAVFADLIHRFGDQLADCFVAVSRDRTDLSDFAVVFDVFAQAL